MGTAETDCQACKHIGRARLRSESVSVLFHGHSCQTPQTYTRKPETLEDFAGQLDGLSQRHAVVAFDPRGYGKFEPQDS